MSSEPPRRDNRFTRSRRLTAPNQYQRVFAGATRAGGPHLTILGKPNDGAEPRLGLAISKKAAPRAVDRNRIKRVVRESFRHHLSLLEGLDVVVLAKPAARHADNIALRTALEQQWHRLHKRCGNS